MRDKIIFWISTGLLSVIAILSAAIYILKRSMVAEFFEALGYSSLLITPLAIVKLLGILVILIRKPVVFQKFAYVLFLLNFLLAASVHLNANGGLFAMALLGIFLLVISFFYNKKAFA